MGKSERIYIRLEPERKRYIEQAAALNSCSMSQFILAAVTAAAEETIQHDEKETA